MKLLLTLATIFISFGISSAQTPQLHTYEIQGDDDASDFVGQFVSMESAVVVAAGPGFAYVQDPQGDGFESTSDGLLLDNSSLGQLSVGQLVTASGIVRELDGQTALSGPNFSFSIVGTQALPDPVELVALTVAPDVPFLERYEGMFVSFDATVGGPSRSSDATIYTTGSRPMREPGVEAPGIIGLPVYDGNPELIIYDPNGFGEADNRFLNAGASFSGLGVLFQDDCCYVLSPTSSVIYNGFDPATEVRARQADEITIGSLNLLNFDAGADDYDTRLEKLSDYVGSSLGFPQILAVQEAWGIQELNALAFQLRQMDPVNGDYQVFLGTGTGSISNGFLVSGNLPEPNISELGTNEFLSIGGILHDRPPLLLSIQLDDPDQTLLQVLNLHMRSLNGIEGSDASFVRTKRHEQAISVAEMVEDLRGENLVIVGDYNAFEFTDGYVDVLSQIGGTFTLGAQRPPLPIVSPPLQNLTVDLLPFDERYSFVFRGSAQMLDHCLANELTGLTVRELEFARGNADAALAFESNQFTTLRSSDHDGFVLFLGVDGLTSTNRVATDKPSISFPNPFSESEVITFPGELAGGQAQIVDLLGRPVSSSVRLGGSLGLPQVDGLSGTSFIWRPDLRDDVSGMYVLQLTFENQTYSWQIFVE
ncbi:MAG: endonuclease/exonuclease/phosphatase family protein [Bacteroidota bacterium]